MMINRERVKWMDGLKGLACIFIFVHHFLLAFYPAVHFGEGAVSHLNGIDTYLAQSPVSVVVNGNYLVMLFCCISGAVISKRVMEMQDKSALADIVVKRYLRLLLPIIPVALVVFLFLRWGVFSNIEAATYTGSPWATWYYNAEMSFKNFIRALFSNVLIYGDDRISTAFWMLAKLFSGTFLSVVLSTVCWRFRRRAWIIYTFVALILFDHDDFALAFCLGTLLAWIDVNKNKMFNVYAGVVALALGVLLGGYPSGVMPTNGYRILKEVPFFEEISYFDWHVLGAFLTLYGISSIKIAQKVLSIKPLHKLGKISYAIFILHIPVLFKFSTDVFLSLKDRVGYNGSVALSLVLSLVLLVILSSVYNRLTEKLTGATLKGVNRLLSGKESPAKNQ